MRYTVSLPSVGSIEVSSLEEAMEALKGRPAYCIVARDAAGRLLYWINKSGIHYAR